MQNDVIDELRERFSLRIMDAHIGQRAKWENSGNVRKFMAIGCFDSMVREKGTGKELRDLLF